MQGPLGSTESELEAGPEDPVVDLGSRVAGAAVLRRRALEDGPDPMQAAAPDADLGQVREGQGESAGPLGGSEQPKGVEEGALGPGQVARQGASQSELVPERRRLVGAQSPAMAGEGAGES